MSPYTGRSLSPVWRRRRRTRWRDDPARGQLVRPLRTTRTRGCRGHRAAQRERARVDLVVTRDVHRGGQLRAQRRFQLAGLPQGQTHRAHRVLRLVVGQFSEVSRVRPVRGHYEGALRAVPGGQVRVLLDDPQQPRIQLRRAEHQREQCLLPVDHLRHGCQHAAGVVGGPGRRRRILQGDVVPAVGQAQSGGQADEPAPDDGDHFRPSSNPAMRRAA